MNMAWLQTPLMTLGSMQLSVYNLLFAFVALFVGLWLGRKMRAVLLARLGQHSGLEKSTIYTIATMVYYVTTLIALLVAVSILGFDITNLAIVAGALSVGIGFGLQDIAKNFISGLLLLFDRSIKVGDFIELTNSGLRGTVEQIRVRSTIVKTPDDLDVIVPNSQFLSDQVVNWTLASDFLRIHVPFGVAYGSDVQKLKQVMMALVDRLPYVVHDNTQRVSTLAFTGMGESSLDFELLIWVQGDATLNSMRTRSETTFAIHETLLKYDFNIPFPQRDLHLKSIASDIYLPK